MPIQTATLQRVHYLSTPLPPHDLSPIPPLPAPHPPLPSIPYFATVSPFSFVAFCNIPDILRHACARVSRPSRSLVCLWVLFGHALHRHRRRLTHMTGSSSFCRHGENGYPSQTPHNPLSPLPPPSSLPLHAREREKERNAPARAEKQNEAACRRGSDTLLLRPRHREPEDAKQCPRNDSHTHALR